MEDHPFELQVSQDHARTAPVGYGALDHELRFLTVDATLAALHGLPAADHVGQPLAGILPTLAPAITPLLRHVLTAGEPILDIDVRGERSDGRLCRWLASYYPVRTRTGSVIAVECAVRALDQRAPFMALATTQAALNQATDQLAFQAAILANLNDAVIAVDPAEHLIYWGPGAERLYGFTADEVRGRPLGDVIRYQWLDPADEQAAPRALDESGSWRGEMRHFHRGGAALTVAASVSVLTSAQGHRAGILSVIRDITDHRRAEAALRASEERFRAVQELSLDGITIVRSLYDSTGAIVDFTCEYLNPVAERLVGQPLVMVRGRRLTDLFPGTAMNGLLERYRQVATSGEPQAFEQYYDTDGISAWYRNMVVRLGDGLAVVFSDITAQKRAEVALRASEERFRQFAAAVKDVFWVSDPAQRQLVYISPAYERLMGRSSAALYANFMEWIEAIHPDDRERVASAFFERIYMGAYEEEFRVVHPDGSVRWVRDRGFPIWDAEGKVVRAAGIAEDITLRKEHEVQIELQARMLDAVGQAVIATDPSGIVLYWNRGAEELYGWTSAEIRGHSVIEMMVGGPDRDQAAAILAALRDGSSWTGELSLYCRDGTRLDVLSTNAPVYDLRGNLIGMISTSVDITRRKRADLERDQLLACTTALAEALTPDQVAAAIFEKVHKVIDAHAGMVALLAEDGRTVEVLKTLTYPPVPDMLQHRLELDMPFPLVDAIRSRQPVWVESPAEISARYPRMREILPGACACAAIPLMIQQRMIGALGMIFTSPRVFSTDDQVYLQVVAQQCAQALERAWLYAAERRAHLAAEDAVHTRDELLALISHDLRNPLSIILGQAQLMVKQVQRLGEPEQSLVARLTVIRDMVSQMDGQLEDLLDVARLRAGQILTLNLEPLDLVALVQEVVRATQATSARHQIRLAAPDSAPLCLGDRRRLARVFENLLSNAINYSPTGGPITVRVDYATDDAGTWGVVSVRDAGLGIPATDLPRVFERFYRGANVAGRIRGTGLGLASARQIVEQHDGRILAVSVEGGGSTFTVHLPCPALDEPTPILPAAGCGSDS
ncbi:MAG: PAS domain S-box protein [Chloroflexales bacterium]|nr:PAS domain S-box protein [Chloroflexales bacterium]